jgi:DNA-binding response OmpR family regulator
MKRVFCLFLLFVAIPLFFFKAMAQKDQVLTLEDSLKVHLSNLRRKLKSAGSNVEVEAVWGIGFKLSVVEEL